MTQTTYTPVERHDGILVKREDLFELHGVRGGKVRQALTLLDMTIRIASHPTNRIGLMGFGGRRSTTAASMAAAARERGRECIFHTADGQTTAEMTHAAELGAEVVRHRPGYLSVAEARAREQGRKLRWTVGLKHPACVAATSVQAKKTFVEMATDEQTFDQIVVVAGAGIHLAGICSAMHQMGMEHKVIAVQVGAPLDETFLDVQAGGTSWRKRVRVVKCPEKYEYESPARFLGSLELDPLYEAKALPYLRKGDLFWVSGIRGRFT